MTNHQNCQPQNPTRVSGVNTSSELSFRRGFVGRNSVEPPPFVRILGRLVASFGFTHRPQETVANTIQQSCGVEMQLDTKTCHIWDKFAPKERGLFSLKDR